MALSSCALSALGHLGAEALEALSVLCKTASTSLGLIKAQKELLKISLDITLIPQQAKQAVLDQLISGVRGAAQIIPPTVTVLCPDLSQINIKLQQAVSAPLEKALAADFSIKQNLSISAQISDELDNIQVAIDFFNDLDDTIKEAQKNLSA